MAIFKKVYAYFDNYFWNNIRNLLLLLGFIAILFYLASYYFIDDAKLSTIFKDIGSVIIAGAIFQFILKSKGFIKVIDETLDHTKRQWTKYNFDYIKKLLETIKDAHSFFEFDFNKTKFESIEKARSKYLSMTEQAKKNNRTEEDEKLLRRNFFIKEITNTRTIYKNGCEIVTIDADVEIIKDGIFLFTYIITLSNPENIFPTFDIFQTNDSAKRFSDFSFSSKIIDLPEKLTNARLQVVAVEDEDKHKKITMTLPETLLEGDEFKLLFSITTKGEYSEDFLKNIKASENPPASSSKYPIGVRNFIIQEEHYGEDIDYNYRLNPKVFASSKEIEKLSEKENLFYKVHKWTIFYSENENGGVNLRLV